MDKTRPGTVLAVTRRAVAGHHVQDAATVVDEFGHDHPYPELLGYGASYCQNSLATIRCSHQAPPASRSQGTSSLSLPITGRPGTSSGLEIQIDNP